MIRNLRSLALGAVAWLLLAGVAAAQIISGPAALTTNGQSAAVAVDGITSATVTITGTWTGTITFRTGSDGGTCSTAHNFIESDGTSDASTTANGQWSIQNAGYTSVCATATASMTGTALVTWTRGYGSPVSAVASGGGDASAANQTALNALVTLTNTYVDGLEASATVIAGAVSSARMQSNPIAGQVGVAAGTSTRDALTQRFTLSTDDEIVTYLNTIQAAMARCDGASLTAVASAASTNATSVRAAAARLCGAVIVNTTATLYYLRLYNLATSPTCSSATGYVATIPIPADTTGAGFSFSFPMGATFSTGLAYCLTGGASSTDNTNAATGIYGVLLSE